jgi:ABC-2 type transport system permease protein
MQQILTVIAKEFLSVYNSRSEFRSLILIPLLFFSLISIEFVIISLAPQYLSRSIEYANTDGQNGASLKQQLLEANPALQQPQYSDRHIRMVQYGQNASGMLLFIPALLIISLSPHALINEKKHHTLEPLLATPITTNQLLVAKCASLSLLASGVFWILSLLMCLLVWFCTGSPELFAMIIHPIWIALSILLVPLGAFFITSLIITVSLFVKKLEVMNMISALIATIFWYPFVILAMTLRQNALVLWSIPTVLILAIISSLVAIPLFNRTNILVGKH